MSSRVTSVPMRAQAPGCQNGRMKIPPEQQAEIQRAFKIATEITDILIAHGVDQELGTAILVSMAMGAITAMWGEEAAETFLQGWKNCHPRGQADARFWNLMQDAKEYDQPVEVGWTKPIEEMSPEERKAEDARLKQNLVDAKRNLKNLQARLRRLRAKKMKLKAKRAKAAGA